MSELQAENSFFQLVKVPGGGAWKRAISGDSFGLFAIRQALYQLIDVGLSRGPAGRNAHDRPAVREILPETKPDLFRKSFALRIIQRNEDLVRR